MRRGAGGNFVRVILEAGLVRLFQEKGVELD
jgi:hypothetical protein